MSSLSILIQAIWQIYVLGIFFSQYVIWLFHFLMISFEEQKVLFFGKNQLQFFHNHCFLCYTQVIFAYS